MVVPLWQGELRIPVELRVPGGKNLSAGSDEGNDETPDSSHLVQATHTHCSGHVGQRSRKSHEVATVTTSVLFTWSRGKIVAAGGEEGKIEMSG